MVATVKEHCTRPEHYAVEKFLSNPTNKTSLINFIVDQWKQPANRGKLQDKFLYVTCGEVCFLLNRGHCNETEALKTMPLHAQHASEDGYRAIVIAAEDTGVMSHVSVSERRCPALSIKSVVHKPVHGT